MSDFGTSDEEACDLPDSVHPAALAVGAGREIAERHVRRSG
ncbi:hypothetical protein [Geodermatophilus sp. TF02-6]|nr:hypothetical protein [Geodermatophilus sp. TF02-6]